MVAATPTVRGSKFRPRLWFGLLCAWTLPSGCAFFGVSYDPCFDADECEPGDGDGDRTGDGDGDGDLYGDGDGDQVTGGSGGGGTGGEGIGGTDSGGAGSGGGGTGGEGIGGTDSGGAGSGGDGSGGDGSGGAGTGGDGTGGSLIDDLERYLHINEIGHAGLSLVELYNSGTSNYDLSSIHVSGQLGDYVNACTLSGSLGPGEIILAQDSTGACLNGVDCIQGCSFDLDGSETVAVYYGEGSSGTWQLVDSQAFPTQLPTAGRTYQANPNGSDTFTTNLQSAGQLND